MLSVISAFPAHVQSISKANFSPFIAYLVLGATVLVGAGQFLPTLGAVLPYAQRIAHGAYVHQHGRDQILPVLARPGEQGKANAGTVALTSKHCTA